MCNGLGTAGRWLFLCAAFLSMTACRLAGDVASLPGDAVRAVGGGGSPKDVGATYVEIQQKLLRITDEYQSGVVIAVERLRRGDAALDPRTLLQLRIALVTATTSIASGADARADLLDMTVFMTATRMSVETHWQPKVFRESGKPLLEVCRNAEADIWKLCAAVLTPEQQEELRRGLEAWQRENPVPENVMAARAVGFASEVASKDREGASKPGSIVNLLSLDPLAGLDPAVREITQARLFAERALFVGQRLPKLLRWHAELFSVEAMDLPASRQLVANTTQATSSMERLTAVAEKLPERLSKEREELVKALESQEKTLKPLVSEVKQTVEAGRQMSEALTTTLKTLDAVVQRATPAGPKDPNAEPFRIQDYQKTAAQVEATAKQATELLATLDRILASENVKKLSEQVAPAVKQGEAAGKEVVDYAFKKALILLAALLASGLIYRFLGPRLAPPPPPKAP